MEAYRSETAKDMIIKSCRSFMQTMQRATSELNKVFLTNLEGLTKTEERKCQVFLQKSNKHCREVLNAAESLLQNYVDEELTSDYEADNETDTLTTVNDIKIKPDPGDLNEDRNSPYADFSTGSQGREEFNDKYTSADFDFENALLFDFKSTGSDEQLVESGTVNESKPSIVQQEHRKTPKIKIVLPKKRKAEPKKNLKPVRKKYKSDDDEDDDFKPEIANAPKQRKKSVRSGGIRKLWPCEYCVDVIFKTRTLLRAHQEEAHGIAPPPAKASPKKSIKTADGGDKDTTPAQKEYKCELCAKTFRLYRDYFRHRKFLHPDHFYQHGGLEEEAATMKVVKPVDLSNIRVNRGVVVDLVTEPENAVRTHVVEPPPSIVTAGDNQGNGTLLKAEAPLVQDSTLMCDVCGKTCKSKTLLKLHMKTHTLAYQCNTCGKRYATSSQLTYHERIHTGEKPHKCDQCDMSFRYSTLLNTHMFTVHCTVKPYQCEQCPESFRFKKTLAVHMVRKHSNIRPYTCNICDKKFVEKVYYNLHMKQHAGVRDYKCDQCESSFCTQPGLQKHKRMCHSEKSIVCHVCAKAFSHQSRLNSHMRVHSGEKKYTCETCGKKFSWGHLLKQHMRTHTGEKPYKCEVCGRQFLCSGNLSKHKKTHR